MNIPQLPGRRNFLAAVPGAVALMALFGKQKLTAGKLEGRSEEDRMIDRYPAFDDKRSKKVVFVAHCIINQSARCNNSGNFASAIPLVPEYLLANKIGIAQIPCPELGALGLGREGNIYDQLSSVGSRRYLRALASDITYQISQYRKHGFTVPAVMGIDCSPSCGVNCHADFGAKPGKGAFMEELSAALAKAGVEIAIIGVEDKNPQKALEELKALGI
jgi:predicted secreted protein